MANNIRLKIGNGNAFICCKKLVMQDQTIIDATVQVGDQKLSGTIAIYCNEMIGGQACPPENVYYGTYEQGVNILNQRK